MKSFKVFLVLMAAVLFSLSASVVFAAGEGARIEAWLMDMTLANGEGRGDVFDDEEGILDLEDLEDIDLDTATAAKALEVHAERIERFKGAHEMSWYGTTTDAERVELGGELLKIFGDIGVDVNEWEAGDFAQAMNNFYDWNKDLSVWDTACVVLGVNPEAFE